MTVASLVLGDMGWGNHMSDWGAGWWIVMTVLMVAFWALVILGIVWLVQSLAGSHRGGRGHSAIAILDHRLASGEISPDEYGQRRDMLNDEGGSESDAP
jgi:putative membrane protein